MPPYYHHRAGYNPRGSGILENVISSLVLALFLVLLSLPHAYAQTTASGTPSAKTGQEQALEEMQHGNSTDAIATLERLAAEHPNQKAVQHDLGLAYYRTGKLINAKQAFERAIAADSQDLESVQLEGLTLYRLGQPAAAIPYLERMKTWSSNANADASHVLGLCYMNSGKFDAARIAFAAEYALPPESGPAYLILARMLTTANLPDQGSEAAQRALTISPELPLAHLLIGEVALYKSDISKALTEFEAERKLNPSYAPVYERLADAHIKLGKYDQAQEDLMQSLALDTSSTGPFLLMGKVLLRKNDPENAAMYLKHAEKMDPSNFIAHTLLGQAYRGLGKDAEAKAELEAASRIHADSELKLQPVK
jgi:tetratricopeptide (TPR) repeat protein